MTRPTTLAMILVMIFYTALSMNTHAQEKPNVILIYCDDLGYGDLSSYGATQIQTPNVDSITKNGTKYMDAHSTSSTCTPSRYALMTGVYPWRKQGTGVLPGDAKLIIPTDKTTLPKIFKQAGYKTAIVGKWHLGLGDSVQKDWNQAIKPGPIEVGFDYSFIFPATADRVPTVFLENHNVIGLDSDDPIMVDYEKKIGTEPTGKENPELLKMMASPGHGHDNTIVNGIGRIGFMTGGKQARWVDEEITPTFLTVAQNFLEENKNQPFFLFFSMTEPHVPRMPSTLFKGKSGLGYRGDAILQMDWTVGQIVDKLNTLGIAEKTIIIFTSDNGPVLDDGYIDGASEHRSVHNQSGPLRGGKYSIFEAGTRVPFIVSGPQIPKNKTSNLPVSQIDIIASVAKLIGQPIPEDAIDSYNLASTIFGDAEIGRPYLIEHAGSLAVVKDNWKYIEPSNRPAYSKLTDIELGNSSTAQLYNLSDDIGETKNVFNKHPKIAKELKEILERERKKK
ncbi:arylsulfatase [Sphingobacterium shayense]|uniref:sulfatase family protein n=1 Tax=Sphingobacterium shayense TaxID=626343 RepID=UPI0015525EA4|nr:arylsulfatase [Sphingobacterium shayense]NQD70851.1 arylsulfatase [Sphingobacterium shayense]